MWHAENPVCTFQTSSVCTGTTPACGNTCGRGAGTHGDVLNVHTGGVLNGHTGRKEGGGGRGEGIVTVSSSHQNLPTYGLSRASEVHRRTPWIFPIFKFENRSRTTCFPITPIIRLIKLFSFSNLEGNFGGNQQPDGSMSLSPSPLLLPPPQPRPPQQHTTRNTQRQRHKERHRDTETETGTETKPKYNERFARQTLSMMFG